MGPIFVLQLRQILGGRKILLLALFLTLPILLSILVRTAGGFGGGYGDTPAGVYLFLVYPQSMCMLLALLYGTAMLNFEIEGKTLTYLFTRPIRRSTIILGKYAAIVVALAIPSWVSLAASWSVVGFPGDGRFILGLALATTAAVLAYTAVFGAIGIVFHRRPMIVGLIYAVVFEVLLSFIPAVVNTLTVTYYLRSLVVRTITGEVPLELARVVGGADLTTSGLVLAGITGVALAFSCIVSERREYALTEQV